ncbi:hypothetical protein [Flavobacterium lindanitolerans]|uniref:hypothetical protein n=1 Tax=Flavobacterium lindanitolerans TaxID=428988 RepID=UPI002807082A|nr:hypothetical protein [Flavobacterium lindanitolerans]MDQ7961372.1 hypothetical protein [Flavobacterium lindanitolerans]
MATSGKDIGNKKWNGEQEKQKGEINEGFSGKNLPENYNPSKGKLKTEIEKDADGNTDIVQRARPGKDLKTDKDLKNKKNPENRDKNSDIDPKRYPSSHPENKRNRGNMK